MILKKKKLYDGKREDFHWVGFGSGSGSNLEECAKIIPPSAIFTDRPSARLLEREIFSDTRKIVLNGYERCGSWVKAQGNADAEAAYQKKSLAFNHDIVRNLKLFEDQMGFEIDLIVLGGYMRLVMEPLLDAYQDKIINVHPADLDRFDHHYRRELVGEDAVYDALLQRHPSLRSSVIIVDGGVDHGEILTQGPILEVGEYPAFTGDEQVDEGLLRTFADQVQGRLKEKSDWPALTTALELIADGRISLGDQYTFHQEWREVFVDDEPMSYYGFRVEDN